MFRDEPACAANPRDVDNRGWKNQCLQVVAKQKKHHKDYAHTFVIQKLICVHSDDMIYKKNSMKSCGTHARE